MTAMSQSKTRRSLLLLLGGALALVLVRCALPDRTHHGEAVTPAEEAVASGSAGPESTGRPAAATLAPGGPGSLAGLGPLPPPTLPLRQQLPDLLARAEAGDPVASCRLLIASNRCREVIRNARFTLKALDGLGRLPRGSETTVVDILAQSIERGNRHAIFCQDLDERELPPMDALVARSVPRLSPRQKTILALTQFDGSLRLLDRSRFYSESGLYVLPQYLADHAVDFLHEGFLAGEPLALEGMVMLHAPSQSLAPNSVGPWLPNPRKFLFYAGLMQALWGADALGPDARLVIAVAEGALGEAERQRIRMQVLNELPRWRALGDLGAASDRPGHGDRQRLSLCDR
jgi:hypothetical protein